MSKLETIAGAVYTLRRLGIEIDSFHATPEVVAELTGEGLTVLNVVTGDARWLDAPNPEGMGRGVASRHEIKLCGIPLEQRV